ncbi:MAG: PAS domain S-box protein [Methanomicrobiaceae archaeon]|nr:PAS domain S-box protein [Methanomicrobiaceae archaeon]
MEKKGHFFHCLVRFFLIASFLSLIIIPVHVSATEEDFSGDVIRIVTDDNYPPFSFRDSSGELQGIIIDQWRLWEENTGILADITGMSWGEAQKAFEAGEYDVLETPMYTPDRAQKYDFSDPYADIEAAIYFNSQISGISGLQSLKGFIVAVKSGDASYDFLIEQGITEFAEYDSYEDIILAAKDGDVVVFAMDSPQADYFLYKFGIQDNFRRTEPLYSNKIHRAVLKGNTAILDTVNNGFNSISADDYDSVDRKWYGISGPSKTDMRLLFVFIGVILILIILLAGWNYVLKLKVREKTAELLKEIESGKKQTAELSESEKRFREIFDNINDAVFLVSADLEKEKGAIISVNRAACRMLGYTAEEFPSLSLKDIHAKEKRGDPGRTVEILKSSPNAVIETEYLRKDGSTFPVEVSIHRFVLGDKNVVLAVARDISERVDALLKLEQSERRYRNVVEDQNELICRFKRDRTIDFANTSFCRYYGLEKDKIEGERIDFEIFPEDRQKLKEHFKSLTPANPVALIEHRVILPDGRVRWQSWSDRAVFDEKGKFIEFQSVGRDITESKRKDEALALAAKKLNILNHVTFSEIQNYLFCERGYLQLAMDLSNDETQKDFLEKQAETMEKIAETLQFARNYQDLGISPPEWHDFEKTFVFAISHTNTSNLRKNIDISGVSVFTDNLLERAISVMISKILTHSRNTTSLSLGYEKAGEMLRIIFETDGKGIPKDSKRNIFTRGGDPETGIDLFLIEEVLSVTNISISENGDPREGIRIEILVPPGIFRMEGVDRADQNPEHTG